mmetsp:Transcript_10813/g.25102  ORF Transcript_10813/g.25102 Transcript_10813/m.25102 type:complete len:824 (-) Transcript_10813:462-2933(-)
MVLITAAEVRAGMLAAGGAPVAKTVPFSQKVEVAGVTHTLDDEYEWLRGKAWPKLVQDEDIIAHLEAENAYCKDFLASLGDLQETFFQTMKGRMKLTDRTVEARHGAFYYYSRTEEALQYAIDCRVPVARLDELRASGTVSEDALRQIEEVILDRNKLAEGKKFCKALGTTVSLNGKVMGYRVDVQGDENYCLQFVDLASGEYLPDKLWNVASYCFDQPADADKTGEAPRGIFYSLRNKNLRPTKIFYHRFGDECQGSEDFAPNDRLLLQSKNEMYGLSVGTTADKEYVTLRHGSKTENEVFVIDVADGERTLVNLLPMVDDVEYSIAKSGRYWFLRTKADCAKDHFRLERGEWVGEAAARRMVWGPYVAEKRQFAFEGMGVTRDYLLLSYLNVATGVPLLVVRLADHPEADTSAEELFPPQPSEPHCKRVAFPGISSPEALSHTAAFSVATDYELNRIVVVLDTPAQPTTWYDWDWAGADDALPVRKQKEVPNYDPEEYHTERFYAAYTEDKQLALHETLHASTDPKYSDAAVSVPVTVLYKKSLFRQDGSMPLLLEGYGSYGISEDPVWRNTHTLYADLGFVVATAHIRGGGDLGEPWYQAAKFLSKKRTFLDFIAVADKLAEEKYTSAGNVAIVGGSAGGMLVGACLNMRPALFKAVVAHVPFVTVLDTMLDGDLPLTPGEFKEWGNPRDEHYFEYMRSYCPYENCRFVKDFLLARRGNVFPSIFATAGLSDYRVGYYEAAKWVARIRSGIAAAKAEAPDAVNEPLLVFETNMAAGHAGASGRFDRLKEVSRDVAFLATEFAVQDVRGKLYLRAEGEEGR